LLALSRRTRSASCLQRIDKYLNEIGSASFTFNALAGGALAPRQNEVYYIFNRRDSKAQLCKLNLVTGQTTILALDRDVQRLFGWSPHERYLMVRTANENFELRANGIYAKPDWLLVYDRDSGKFLPITKEKLYISNNGVWLDDNSFLYCASRFADREATHRAYLARVINGAFQSSQLRLPTNAVEALSSRSKAVSSCGGRIIAIATTNGIGLVDIATGVVTSIEALSNTKFTGVNWLNFSTQTGQLIFCATQSGGTNRNVFAYDLEQRSIEGLTTVHSYNGQWLQDGKSYAFIGKDNDYFLGVRDREGRDETNLFTKGYVDYYAASTGGKSVVAIALTNREPGSLWRYDLAAKTLDCLKPGAQVPFKFSKISEAQGRTVRAADGLDIPVYLFPPTDRSTVKRFPLVILVPARTGPSSRNYEVRSQLLANLGFYYVGVNYRGCDGYGSFYSGQWNEDKAAGDVLTVIQVLSKELPCDMQRVFAVSSSAGSSVLQSFLRQFPTVLRGAVFLGPGAWEPAQLLEIDHFPRLFVSVGRNDSGFRDVQRFEEWTRAHGVSASFQYLPNYAHFGPDISKRIAQERAVAEFLLQDL